MENRVAALCEFPVEFVVSSAAIKKRDGQNLLAALGYYFDVQRLLVGLDLSLAVTWSLSRSSKIWDSPSNMHIRG
jgi:hypothetical protein